MIPKSYVFILLNGLLNINAWIIWFGNLSGIYTQSGYNPYRMCQGIVDLASVAWESQFVNPQGGKIPISWHKKTSRDFCIFSSRDSWDSSRFLFEILIIKSSRDAHHHSSSHILYEHMNLVEICTSHLDEICHHIHTRVASSRDMCYHMYIHIEITARALCTRNATRSR